MKNFFSKSLLGVLAIIVCGVLCACNRASEPKKQAEQPAPTPQPPAAFAMTDELKGILVTADTADGKEDHTIGKCITCKLHMSGSPSHAAEVGDYTAHLCSESCKAAFEKDPAKAILAVKSK